MSFVLGFLPEASAEVECITGRAGILPAGPGILPGPSNVER